MLKAATIPLWNQYLTPSSGLGFTWVLSHAEWENTLKIRNRDAF